MEEDGLLKREVFAEVPPRVEYTLTDRGRSLEPVIDAMRVWGEHTWPNSLLKKKPPTSRTKLRTFQRFDERPVTLLQFVVRQIALERFERHERAPQQARRGIERQLCMVAI